MRFILNLPWSLIGFFLALIGIPMGFSFIKGALVVRVATVWFIKSRYRAVTFHRVIIHNLKPDCDSLNKTIKHELIHTEQYERYWGIFPFIYIIESWRHGYSNNCFEVEAREKSKRPD